MRTVSIENNTTTRHTISAKRHNREENIGPSESTSFNVEEEVFLAIVPHLVKMENKFFGDVAAYDIEVTNHD